jgi:OOP family OmpA-OmpF porin
MLALTERVNNIENKMLDTDNDGVANYLDQEANTGWNFS